MIFPPKHAENNSYVYELNQIFEAFPDLHGK